MAEGKRRGTWSDMLPAGQDFIGQGFPSYGGGGFVQETQTIGDMESVLGKAGTDIAKGKSGGLWCGLLGSDCKFDILGGAAADIGGAAGAVGGAFWKAYGAKIIIGGLGAIFLVMGLVAVTKGTGVGGEIAAGIREGIANARQ